MELATTNPQGNPLNPSVSTAILNGLSVPLAEGVVVTIKQTRAIAGEIRNPLKAATLMAMLPNGYVPLDLSLSPDGVLSVFFEATPDFLEDSKRYDLSDLPTRSKAFQFFRQRLLAMKHGETPLKVRELARLVRPIGG